jgi:uncharacterized protein (DUF58 family)
MHTPRAVANLVLIISLSVIGHNLTAANARKEVIEIRFFQQRFNPARVEVPAGVPLAIRVVNASKERIEFESLKLNREKVVEPGETVTVNVPPLKAGSYDFYDDFNDDVPEGKIVAK